MFGRNKQSESSEDIKKIQEMKTDHLLAVKELESKHKLEVKELEFKIKHQKDEEVVELKDKLHQKEIRIAELEKENKMLDRIVDLNGDIVDVKNLVSKLIDKLPQIDLKSLTVNNNGSK